MRNPKLEQNEPQPLSKRAERGVEALAHFKDWTNYLLVTSVAAMGWVVSDDAVDGGWKTIVILLLALSVLFAILTLSLVPIVAERIDADDRKSIYDINAPFYFRNLSFERVKRVARLKDVCFIQHITFILAIAVYALGAIQ